MTPKTYTNEELMEKAAAKVMPFLLASLDNFLKENDLTVREWLDDNGGEADFDVVYEIIDDLTGELHKQWNEHWRALDA